MTPKEQAKRMWESCPGGEGHVPARVAVDDPPERKRVAAAKRTAFEDFCRRTAVEERIDAEEGGGTE